MQIIVRGLVLLTSILALTLPLGAQAPPVPSKPPEKKDAPKEARPKARRVWTEDDISSVRKPWDKAADKKTAAEETKAAEPKSKPEAKPEAPPAEAQGFVPPKTVEEAEQRIADKQEEIRLLKERILQTRREYYAERDESKRADLIRREDETSKNLENDEAELQLLEKTLADLEAKSAASPPAPAKP